jgi:hypothetical protein
MSETQQDPIEPTATDDASEVETNALRATHQDLLMKRRKDKARIAELEVQAIALQDAANVANAATQDALIGVPLRRMAAMVSDVPELFMAEFAKHYTIDADKSDGTIIVTTLDGKPALDRNGKAVEFTPHGLYNLLASQAATTKDARSRTFAVLMRYFGGSGGANLPGKQSSNKSREPKPQFGLR